VPRFFGVASRWKLHRQALPPPRLPGTGCPRHSTRYTTRSTSRDRVVVAFAASRAALAAEILALRHNSASWNGRVPARLPLTCWDRALWASTSIARYLAAEGEPTEVPPTRQAAVRRIGRAACSAARRSGRTTPAKAMAAEQTRRRSRSGHSAGRTAARLGLPTGAGSARPSLPRAGASERAAALPGVASVRGARARAAADERTPLVLLTPPPLTYSLQWLGRLDPRS
jgi:hypothetical protein